MVNEMVERAARALAQAAARRIDVADNGFFYRRWPGGVPEYVEARWGFYESDARVVIEAMREPTEAQYEALSATDKMWCELDSKTVWQTYIDAALSN